MCNYKKIVLSALILTTSLLSCACGNGESTEIGSTISTVSVAEESTTQVQTREITTVQETTQITTEKVKEKLEENTTDSEDKVTLGNEYKTRYQEVNMVTYPPFIFNYPDSWRITKEECDPNQELVILENDNGTNVTFLHYCGKLESGGSGVNMSKVEISKAASSQFVPGSVQATDHSDLGEFMVAKIKTIGTLNMRTDSEYTDIDGGVSYAVLPVGEQGVKEGVRRAISGEYTFWYSDTISFTASTSEESTPQEEKEVIAILNSFRLA